MLIPSIDIMDGKAVQLVGGREKVLEVEDVPGLARRFRVFGEIAVIDLDAALGRGDNLSLIKRLCTEAPCRVGGGIRTAERAGELLRAGARSLIIGTAASEEFLRRLPREQSLVAVDFKDGSVQSHGWTAAAGETPEERMQRLAPFCAGFLATDVATEGRMRGIDPDRAARLKDVTGLPLTWAGSITTSAEVAALDRLGIDAQVGMSLYTGRLDPAEAFISCIDFQKGGGLLPCIVQDEQERTLMLAYQSPPSLRQALVSGQGVYFSRSRNQIWIKGETSGHRQLLLQARTDCDRDVLLFTVRQTGPACHTGQATCFGRKQFHLEDLSAVIENRRDHPAGESYTARLLSGPDRLDAKLREELAEVLEAARRPDDLIWECADLLYFLLVKMAAGGIHLSQVTAELARRRSTPAKPEKSSLEKSSCPIC